VKGVVAFRTVLATEKGVFHRSSFVANFICLARKVLFIFLKIKFILAMQHKPVHTSFKSPEKALHQMKLIKEKLLQKQTVSFSLLSMWSGDSKLLFSLILPELQKKLFSSFVAGL